MDTLIFYFQFLYAQFVTYPLITRITVLVVTLIAIIYLISVLRLFYLRNMMNRYNRQFHEIKRKYELEIKDIIQNPNNLDKEKINNKLCIFENDNKYKWQKNIFTELLLNLKDQFNSEQLNRGNYMNLIEILQLEEFWEKEISTGSINRKIEGIRKLEELTDDVITGVVAPYLYHRNDGLRKLARNVYLKFEKVDAFKFIADKKSEADFNKLDELKLHSSFKQKAENNELPLLSQWIENSENINFKCFLIREISFFHQVDSAPYLEYLFEKSTNPLLKAEITRTLNTLKYDEIASNLTNKLNSYSTTLQY